MRDPLLKYPAYTKALEFYDNVAKDTDLLMKDTRGREIARQLIRAAGSISANFEEGYGRATTGEFVRSLRIAMGEARETKGWYRRSKRFLPKDLILTRMQEADEVIALLISTVKKIEERGKGDPSFSPLSSLLPPRR